MFAREQRLQTARHTNAVHKAQPSRSSDASTAAEPTAPQRRVCPCGGGCPACASEPAEGAAQWAALEVGNDPGQGTAEVQGGAPLLADYSMSAEETRAYGVALLSARRIEVALKGSLDSLHQGRVSASRYLAGSAIAAKRTIQQHLESEQARFEQRWEAEEIDAAASIVAERKSLDADYDTRRSEVQQRVDVSVTGADTLFTEHQSRLDKVAKDGGAACERSRLENRRKLTQDVSNSESQIASIAVNVAGGWDSDDRGDSMRDGVMWVEGKVSHTMDEGLEEALQAIDRAYLQQDDPQGGGKVSLQSLVEGSSNGAQAGFDKNKQQVLASIAEAGPVAQDAINSYYAQESGVLDEIQISTTERMRTLKQSAMAQMERQAQDQIDAIDLELPDAQAALVQAERVARRRLEPLGKRAIALLRSGSPPLAQEAEDVAMSLERYFQAGADAAAEGMLNGAADASISIHHGVSKAEKSLKENASEAIRSAIQSGLDVSERLGTMNEQRVRSMGLVSDELGTALDDTDGRLIERFDAMVEEFRKKVTGTVASMDSKIAEALLEGKEKNQKVVGTVREAMLDEANDRGYKYDHRFLHAAGVGLKSGWGAIKATLNLIKGIITGILAAFVIAIALIVIGIPAAIASAIAAVAVIAIFIVRPAIQSYRARVAKGQTEFDAVLGSVGDVTGISEIYHGFADEYLTLPERTEMIVSGGENLAMLIIGEGKEKKGIDGVAEREMPWLDEPPPTPAAPAVEAAGANTGGLGQDSGGPSVKAWEPAPLKQQLGQWYAEQLARSAANDNAPAGAHASAPAAPVGAEPVGTATANAAPAGQLHGIDPSPTVGSSSVVTPETALDAASVAGDAARTAADAAAQDSATQPAEIAREAADAAASPAATPVTDAVADRAKDAQQPGVGKLLDLNAKLAQAAEAARQAAEAQHVEVQGVEVDANEAAGQQVQAMAAGGGRRGGSSGGTYRQGGVRQGSTTSRPPSSTGSGSPRSVFGTDTANTPGAVSEGLRDAGLSPGEIVSFGGENASKLTPGKAKLAARLGEHFTPEDMKALGGFLERTGKVLNQHAVATLIESVKPGELTDALKQLDFLDSYKDDAPAGIEADPDQGVTIEEPTPRKEKKADSSPDEAFGGKKGGPLWKMAETALKDVLRPIFGSRMKTGKNARFRSKNLEAVLLDRANERNEEPFPENLNSTIPDVYIEPGTDAPTGIAYEVKRLNLQEVGIDVDGKTIGSPSRPTMEAIARARSQLATRRANMEGVVQNIVFNITGQSVDTLAVGRAIRALLTDNGIHYDNVFVQEWSDLTPIDGP